ncbi:heparinase II/III-like protein [Dichotomicrobium thermohalophilum]|uniref:Heparinase II/III-like protein n=1 Tax=Dichotomicrobium thermohalophilum TaxID=933063 RepID=A0A397Q3U8_9HYPH|nr:heparinase II/III-like protein [Dichotomicrobium thermohalophilum]
MTAECLSGGGTLTTLQDHVSCAFRGGAGSYQLRLRLPRAQVASGVGARIRLRGWEYINYICIGYSWKEAFAHVKAAQPAIDRWFDFLVGHDDLAWGWHHDWAHPEDREIADIRLYIKGAPGARAYLDVGEMLLWQEDRAALPDWLDRDQPVPEKVVHAIEAYERKCFRSYTAQAQEFLETGKCPLYGETMLDWPATATLPPGLTDTGTYQYSWHALHAATMLMLRAHDSGETGPLFAAREFVAGWIERSYFRPDPNLKYAWYDHGTAERCLAMVQLYAVGQQHGFDQRFMARLRRIIFRHAQLLASEVFYAGHQPTRYHNHAWFQDLALLAVTLAFPSWPCSQGWGDTALSRLEDQFAKLIQRDNGYAVFVENSIGYHHGVQRILEFAGNLAMLSGRDTPIPAIAEELRTFSEFFRYPDPRHALSQGDTFRLPNQNTANPRGQIPYGRREVTVLPEAGYAIVKADHENRPFMLTMLATSLSKTHKHEDNLALTLYFDGVEWLIDPSFHSHEYTAPIPAYLRSAAAHNCVFVPDLPYALEPGLAWLEGG